MNLSQHIYNTHISNQRPQFTEAEMKILESAWRILADAEGVAEVRLIDDIIVANASDVHTAWGNPGERQAAIANAYLDIGNAIIAEAQNELDEADLSEDDIRRLKNEWEDDEDQTNYNVVEAHDMRHVGMVLSIIWDSVTFYG